MLAERVKKIQKSLTMNIAAKAIEMRSQGIDIIDFSVGEPDFNTPEIIKDAGKISIDDNLIKYTVNAGLVSLREVISRKLKLENHLIYDPSQIIVSNGAKQGIFNAILALANPGDEVLIPAPFYVSYPEMVKFADAVPVIIQTDEKKDFKLSAELLEKSITPKSKVLIICNPSNPTGLLYSKEELTEIVSVLEKFNIVVISDEVYEKLVYGHTFHSFSSISNSMKDKTVIINGASKAFAMTGWRLGYAAGPKDIIDAMDKIQSHSTSAASAISQYAALEALKSAGDDVQRMVNEYENRRTVVMEYLNKIHGITYSKPDGAFYIFPNISHYLHKSINGSKINNSFDLSLFLLEDANVNTVPGAVFGSDDHIRISYSTTIENIKQGMKRLINSFKKLE